MTELQSGEDGTIAVDLTATELLLLRVCLNESVGNVSFGAVDHHLDAKLSDAQGRLSGHNGGSG